MNGSTLPVRLPPVGRFLDRITETREAVEHYDASIAAGLPFRVCVQGSLGSGRTTYAVSLAHKLSVNYSGTYWCRSWGPGCRRTWEDLLKEIAHYLRMPDSSLSAQPSILADAINDVLHPPGQAEKKLLIVVQDATPDEIIPLLQALPTAGFIVTTSVTGLLALRGGHRFRVVKMGGLPDSDAVALMTEIAGRGADFSGEEAALSAIAGLCLRLPGLTSVCGAQLQGLHWTATGYTQHLAESFQRRLNSGDLQEPQLSIQVVFTASYRDLSETERRGYRWLSRVPGPFFTRDLAAAVFDCGPSQAGDLLEALEIKALVQVETDDVYRLSVPWHASQLAAESDSESVLAAADERILKQQTIFAVSLARSLSPRPVDGEQLGSRYYSVPAGFGKADALREYRRHWPGFLATHRRAIDAASHRRPEDLATDETYRNAIMLLIALWPFAYQTGRAAPLLDAHLHTPLVLLEPAAQWMLLRDKAGLHEKLGELDTARHVLQQAIAVEYRQGWESSYLWIGIAFAGEGDRAAGEGNYVAAKDKHIAALEQYALAEEARQWRTDSRERPCFILWMHRGRSRAVVGLVAEGIADMQAALAYFEDQEEEHNIAYCADWLADIASSNSESPSAIAGWEYAAAKYVAAEMPRAAAAVRDKMAALAEGEGRTADAAALRTRAAELRAGL